MRRRTVIAGLPWLLSSLPHPAWAYASRRGAPRPFPEGDAEGRVLSAAFDAVLRDHGQRDLEVDHRWKGHDREAMRARAAEVVRAEPRVIVTYLNGQLHAVAGLTRRIPTVYAIRRFPHRGGMMSYGPNPVEVVRRTPTKSDLVVSLTTARALGFETPSALLAQADEVVG